ncbi:GTP cyclohydrolase III [Halalkalicoccus jeotgali]|uniref:GTP cyclohydrolase III n=1 Tax=Halalkalicoccus jeotgali (strain DSM 18796 / CECT 7217 / JCM 14584 / KCTC 4019 / B3) TaxID=795797 RepID=D8J9B6_HALJB|nr:GTP cyclohydrolase III [Halalkalicoccus jeotgali]ADJ16385.1 GTP cyclohydrolase III [Halalkalicoccus jeotgali B3]ELY37119.1 GTP cyclohydrolase III [Halalkalicoccus jeotgali B3]
MTRTQITLVQIDNYGPWTVTPEPRREVDLQTLQSRLYADLCQQIGREGGYVFFARFDNMIAVTNGLDWADHELIQESIANRYPVSVSMGIGTGTTPQEALAEATGVLQTAGSAQDGTRTEILGGDVLDEDERAAKGVQVAHFDVIDVTGTYTDRVDAFETFIAIEQGYAALMRYMYGQHDSLSFFVGGDNVIAVCPDLPASAYEDAIVHVSGEVGVDLQVGVGRGASAHDAGMAAKHALEECRHNGTRVERALPADD